MIASKFVIHKSQKYLDAEFKGFFYLRKNSQNNKALYNIELLDIAYQLSRKLR